MGGLVKGSYRRLLPKHTPVCRKRTSTLRQRPSGRERGTRTEAKRKQNGSAEL